MHQSHHSLKSTAHDVVVLKHELLLHLWGVITTLLVASVSTPYKHLHLPRYVLISTFVMLGCVKQLLYDLKITHEPAHIEIENPSVLYLKSDCLRFVLLSACLLPSSECAIVAGCHYSWRSTKRLG